MKKEKEVANKKDTTQNFFVRAYQNRWIGPIFVFLAGTFFGYFSAQYFIGRDVGASYLKFYPLREQNSSYQYINPLLACILPNSKEFFMNFPLETKIRQVISTAEKNGSISSASVYYRDLNYGRWVGVNESAEYDPASMLKVVIMIAYFKQAESNPSILKKVVTYDPASAEKISDVLFQTPSDLKVGGLYTIEKLIEEMIIHSDNGAKDILIANLDSRSLSEVYSDIGVDSPDDAPGDYIISSKNYSLFFRVLYNATYLNREMSEKALGLLVKAQYKDALVAGVPKGVQVAQKYGEHVDVTADLEKEFELHDCGIVYKPNVPYVLCVMTKGKDPALLAETIRNISHVTYDNTLED